MTLFEITLGRAGRLVFSVCTGALLCGAVGILRGRQATTRWAAWNLLPHYGAASVRSRVVVDGKLAMSRGDDGLIYPFEGRSSSVNVAASEEIINQTCCKGAITGGTE
jgi:hypothetical protein